MKQHVPGKMALVGAFSLLVVLTMLAACGVGANGSAATGNTAATATACAQVTRTGSSLRASVGTVKSISGQTLVLTTTQGKDEMVAYTDKTTFTQEVKLKPSELKEGSTVRVAVSSSGNSYTALSVTVSSGTSTGRGGFGGGFGGFGGGNGARRNGTPGAGGSSNPCFSAFRTGTPGAGAARGTGTSGSARSLNGTVNLINGSTLTVKDSSGGIFQVKLTGTTQIIETKSATASALKVGQPLTVAGTPDSQGAITATVIAILLALPQTNRPVATATP